MKAYDDSDKAAERELTKEEIEFVKENKRHFLKDPTKIMHFVGRALVTVRVFERRVSDSRESLEALRAQQSNSNHPVENALQMLRNLSEEEKEQIFNYHVKERVATAEKALKDANRAQIGAKSEANRVRFSLGKLVNDPSLPDNVRKTLEDVLKNITPTNVSVENVETPTLDREKRAVLPASFQPVQNQPVVNSAPVETFTSPQKNALPPNFQKPPGYENNSPALGNLTPDKNEAPNNSLDSLFD